MNIKYIVNISVALIVCFAGWVYITAFYVPVELPSKAALGKVIDLGPVGDYVGGILNPLISLLALIWLSQSFLAQKQELSETKKALSESAYYAKVQVRITGLSAILASTTQKLAMLESRKAQYTQMLHQDAINEGESDDFTDGLKNFIQSTSEEIRLTRQVEDVYIEELRSVMNTQLMSIPPKFANRSARKEPNQQKPS